MTVLPHYPCRNPQKSALGFTRDGSCSLTSLQQQQLPRIPLSRGNLQVLQIIPCTGQNLQQSQGQVQLKAQLHLRKMPLQKTIFKQLHKVYRNNALCSKRKRSTKLYVKNDTEIETSEQNSLENQRRSCIVRPECN